MDDPFLNLPGIKRIQQIPIFTFSEDWRRLRMVEVELTPEELAANHLITELAEALTKRSIKYRLTTMDGAWWLWSGNGNKAWCLRELRRVISTKELVVLFFNVGGELIVTSCGNWIDRT
jgi:hypothetical protein